MNKSINELRKIITNEYAKGSLHKNRDVLKKCTDLLFDFEKGLYTYQELLNNNPARQIVISEEGIYAEFIINDHIIKMYLDPVDRAAVPTQILARGEYESEEMRLVLKIIGMLSPSSIVFDIGANLGWYGLNIQNSYKESQIYYFEPVPETYIRLKKNVILNGYNEDRVYNFGFYSDNCTKKFYFDILASGASSLANLRELTTTKTIEVEMMKMDDFARMEHVDSVDFIKCDVEGAELFVYEGGANLINRSKPVVFSEMLRKWAKKLGYHPNDIIRFFKEIGYGCYVINGYGLRLCEIITDDTVEKNFFFLHEIKHKKIINTLVDD